MADSGMARGMALLQFLVNLCFRAIQTISGNGAQAETALLRHRQQLRQIGMNILQVIFHLTEDFYILPVRLLCSRVL